MVTQQTETFAGLLLRHRGRTGLTQRDLATRLGTSRRSIQDWESGAYHPSAERLQALLGVLFESGGLIAGREVQEAHELWEAALREAPRMHTPLDQEWLEDLLDQRHAPQPRLSRGVHTPEPVEQTQYWGEAPDVIAFVGRSEELATLRTWLTEERCRLVAILGMGGIGKSALASRLAQEGAPGFQRVYWRSLRDALPPDEWLAGAIGFLSGHQVVPPPGSSARVAALLQLLRDRPSLLVLDNFETVLEPGQQEGRYRDGFAAYGALLGAIGETGHQSCLLVTSREAPPELAVLGGGAVRRLQLGGLGVAEGRVLLAEKQLSGTDEEWATLVARVGGNGLALKVVGESIHDLFDGDIAGFLEQAGEQSIVGGIRRLLAEQIERSSELEQKLLRVLAVEREAVSLSELIGDLGPRVRPAAALEAVEALRRRSLVERAGTTGVAAFTLQSVVLEYVTDRLVEDVGDEIARGQPLLLVEQPIIRAQAKDYVRQTQERLIGERVFEQVRAECGSEPAEERLLRLLDAWRERPPSEQGYGPGNVVNLLRLGRGDLRRLNLSRLAIRQAYLAMVDAQDATLEGADMGESVLAEAFDFPGSVALSADGSVLAVGTSTGQVCVWRVADRTLVATLEGHTGAVWGVALSADGKLLASSGAEGSVRLWEPGSGRSLAVLTGHVGAVSAAAVSAHGEVVVGGGQDGTVRLWQTPFADGEAAVRWIGRVHTGGVRAVAVSADGQVVASAGQDRTVVLWDARSGRHTATLQGHTGALWGVALSVDGQYVASGGQDGTVRLWNTRSGRPLATLHGPSGGIWSAALSADGRLLASGGGDGTLRLWKTPSLEENESRPLAILHGHTGSVWGAALSGDGRLLASGGGDGTVRLWEAETLNRWRPVATLQGHTGGVRAVALAARGELVASGGQDGIVRLWEAPLAGSAREHRLTATAPGHSLGLWGVALSADGALVASGGADRMVRLWETRRGRLLTALEGHAGGIWSVALSADGQHLASGDEQGAVWLRQAPFDEGNAAERWAGRHARSEQPTTTLPSRVLPAQILEAHPSAVASLALSADGGRLLASGGADGTLRVWEVSTRRLLADLEGHTSAVWGVALDPGSRMLASGSEDGAIRLWDLTTSQCLATLQGHTNAVYGVALSEGGELLATCGADGTVRLWDTGTARLRVTLRGHAGVVRGVALSADGRLVVSGGFDETVRLWDADRGVCLRVLRSARRYERVDITGLSGITNAQRQALIALGAADRTSGGSSVMGGAYVP
jgi:WD40 repeat protein/transcriptional regulator with XRE-family HTH domain